MKPSPKRTPTWQEKLAKLPPEEQVKVIAVLKKLRALKKLH